METAIPGIILIEPSVHRDDRGFFLESYRESSYRDGGIRARFVQDNHSSSVKNTLRGLHGQSPNPQGKLVRVIEGEIFDVSVDARRGSPTFGKHFATRLSAENFHQLYIPPGLLHGFLVTSDVAQVVYKCTDFYRPEADFSVAWNDPEIGIDWPIDAPILSEKDRCAPRLRDVENQLIDYSA
ncbi:MAG: dTDP-4-dehydrorhamnose 3,5-epimerase [Deltaproteobacteria bacterium]|jgi:dTDP-4-dehydrorhamnose 3,5-epimerase|nr:dTDP-4-dehydrorhamnose 3,5-epimerase [Deltaproteobacteria bacterium]